MAREAVNKDKAMAAHLKAIGYPHGRRMTAPSVPAKDQVGSNKYQRYLASQRARRIKG